MAEICPVCNKEIGFLSLNVAPGIEIHNSCGRQFNQHPEKYGGKEKIEALINLKKETSEQRTQEIKEHQKQQQRIEDKSVHVKSFDMPFGDMVMFMVKWAIASIPAFIILTIIGAFIVAIFGSLFF